MVSKITSQSREEITEPKIEKRVISQETSNKLTSMLISVVENGSARLAKIPGYYIAAKTGTAQIPKMEGGYYEDKSIQSAIGYFPALNPKFLVYVKLDDPKNSPSSGQSAVPIFKEIAEYAINLYQIPPDYQ